MPKYNLEALGHEEFERLCQSLVQQVVGPGAKVYGMGKDAAREATFEGKAPYPSKEEQWDGKWIFQAKFHDISQIGPREARRSIMAEIDDELGKITKKYRHPCDNFILMTNVPLTPAFQKGTRDVIDQQILPKYKGQIKNIHVWGADEICRFLDAYPGIRQTYGGLLVSGDIVAYLLGLLDRERNQLGELIKLYCQGCFDHEKHAILDDAGDVEDKPIPLANVFVDLNVILPDFPQEPSRLEALPAWIRQVAGDEERKSAMSYLLDDSLQGIVLVGSPGQGKSTLGQFLAQVHRARLLRREQEFGEYGPDLEKCCPRIPFRVTLRDYAQWMAEQKQKNQPDGLSSYMAILVSRDADRSASAENIQAILQSNSSLLILDGLDEVADKELRRRMLDNIAAFVNQVRDVLGGNIRVIATTRPYGYSEEFDPTHYLHLTLDRLSPQIGVLYAKRWTRERQINQAEGERILSAFNACLRDNTISVLTGTPLQVTILLIIIRARGTPPKQREELFDRYMDIIYQREQRKRLELLQTSQNLIYGLHKYLAYILHRRAVRDETSARMPINELESAVREYLSRDPTLSEPDLESTTRQIIKEASERLVLIVGLREGMVGFELTSVREFFAAAHLVDTARDSKERDARFKAICRSPHWRNVALFFAGRVGRRLPGEAPSLIDVCREIDTERLDRLLKRGAALAMQIADDRAMREVHNEVGAIQYGLTRLEAGLDDADRFANVLKGFPERYLQRVILPELEGKLSKLPAEEIKLYGDLYQKLHGGSPALYECIKKAASHTNLSIRLWALRQAIQNQISEQWVIDLLESMAGANERLTVNVVSHHVENFTIFLDFPLSALAREILELSAIRWSDMHSRPWAQYSKLPDKLTRQITSFGERHERNILRLTLHALNTISGLFSDDFPSRVWGPTEVEWASLLDPQARQTINKLRIIFDDVSNTVRDRLNPTELAISALISLWGNPADEDARHQLLKVLEEEGRAPFLWGLIWRLGLWGALNVQAQTQNQAAWDNLAKLARYYGSREQLATDQKNLTTLLSRQSKSVSSHPQKVHIWLMSGCNEEIERHLDKNILAEILAWLDERGITKQALTFLSPMQFFSSTKDPDFAEFILDLAAHQIDAEKETKVLSPLAGYYLDIPALAKEQNLREKVQLLARKVLETESLSNKTATEALEVVYWFGVFGDLVKTSNLFEVTRRLRKATKVPSGWWGGHEREEVFKQAKVLDLVKNSEIDISAVGAVSLETFNTRIADPTVGESLYGLAQDSSDTWQPRYLAAMSPLCQYR